MSAMLWDPAKMRVPSCYLPPIWEVVIGRDMIAAVRELAVQDPTPQPTVVAKHLNARIAATKRLVEAKKLDAKIGAVAINHFQAHLKELEALPK
jgi:hypothetical protein